MEVFNGYGMLLAVLIGLIPIVGYVIYYIAVTKRSRKKERLAKKVAQRLSRTADMLELSKLERKAPEGVSKNGPGFYGGEETINFGSYYVPEPPPPHSTFEEAVEYYSRLHSLESPDSLDYLLSLGKKELERMSATRDPKELAELLEKMKQLRQKEK